MRVSTIVLLCLISALLSEQTATAAEIEGVAFRDRIRVGSSELRLHGTGLLRYRLLVKGYVAALYLDEAFRGDATPSSALADVPRRIEVEYFWAISAEQFASATVEGMARTTNAGEFERFRSRIGRLNALYEDVDPGDRYALTYLPGVGTELTLNGRRLGVIEGEGFGAALFGIWLGDEAIDASLRRQLLASG